ncbi:MAG TPA: hypothetical protein V6D29_21795 [Leptolyngbyaceae cyanobacterium]
MLKQALVLSAIASALPLAFSTSAQAQSSQCVPLQVVGADQTEINKTVSTAAAGIIPGIRTNWDTDWAVPGGEDFSQFRANIVSEAGGDAVDVDMYLKYSDQTVEHVYHAEGVA